MDTIPAGRRGAPSDKHTTTPSSAPSVGIDAAPPAGRKVSNKRSGRTSSAKAPETTLPTAGTRSLSVEDFLDLTAHELRAPLTILKGQAQLLQMRIRRSDAESDRTRDIADLDKMLFQIERLNHQVSVLLDATHLSQRRFTLAPLRFDLEQILQRLVALCAAGSPSLVIEYEAPAQGESFIGKGDRQRIETALCELLFNAVRYGGVRCTVRLSHEGDVSHPQARLEVEDTGIGIPARERSMIFQQWTHGSNAEHPGLGLGLYVTREIVRRHHGRIGVRPRGKGSQRSQPGTVFWLTLPLAPDEGRAREPAPSGIAAGKV